jgi:hypothetical protein
MDLIEIEWGGMDWFHLSKDRDQRPALVDTVVSIRALKKLGRSCLAED